MQNPTGPSKTGEKSDKKIAASGAGGKTSKDAEDKVAEIIASVAGLSEATSGDDMSEFDLEEMVEGIKSEVLDQAQAGEVDVTEYEDDPAYLEEDPDIKVTQALLEKRILKRSKAVSLEEEVAEISLSSKPSDEASVSAPKAKVRVSRETKPKSTQVAPTPIGSEGSRNK